MEPITMIFEFSSNTVISFLSFFFSFFFFGVEGDKSYGNLSWMKDKVGNQCKFQKITVCKVMALAVSDVLTMLKNLNNFWIRGSCRTCSHFIVYFELYIIMGRVLHLRTLYSLLSSLNLKKTNVHIFPRQI